MNNFNAKNYIPVLIIIFFLIAAAGGIFLVWPKFQESGILRENVAAKKEEIKNTEAYFKKLKEIKIQLETDYLNEISEIDTALPSAFSVPSLMKFLQETSAQAGLSLKSITPPAEESRETSSLQTIRIGLDAEGSYSAFKNFLSILENSSRLIEIESIAFSSGDSLQKGKELSSYSVQIKTSGY